MRSSRTAKTPGASLRSARASCRSKTSSTRRRSCPSSTTCSSEQDHTALPEIESIRRSNDAFSAKFTGISWP